MTRSAINYHPFKERVDSKNPESAEVFSTFSNSPNPPDLMSLFQFGSAKVAE